MHYIVQLSILLTHDKTTNRFYSNFNQLYSDLKSPYSYLMEFYPDQEQTERDQYFMEITLLDEKILPAKKGALTSNIINWINNRYYAAVMVSESLIPGTYLYKKPYYPLSVSFRI